MLFVLSADRSNSQSDFCGKVPFLRAGLLLLQYLSLMMLIVLMPQAVAI